MPLSQDPDGIVSQFRGLPAGRTPGKSPVRPSDIIEKIFLDNKVGKTSPLKVIHENWDEFVPARLSGMSEPSDMGRTVLYVRTFSAAAKQELVFEEKKILAKINALGGCSGIRKIKFL